MCANRRPSPFIVHYFWPRPIGTHYVFLYFLKVRRGLRNMSRVYYKEAMGAFVVFDTTKMETLEAASTVEA